MTSLPVASDMAKSWIRARTKVEPAQKLSAVAQAFSSIARGAMDEALTLCRAHPALLGILNDSGSTLLAVALGRPDFEGALALTALGAVASPESNIEVGSPHQRLARAFALAAVDAHALERASAAISGSGRPAPSHSGWLLTAIELGQWSLAWDCARRWSLPSSSEIHAVVGPKLISDPDSKWARSGPAEPFKTALTHGVSTPGGWAAWSMAAWLSPFWSAQERAELWRSALLNSQLETGDILAAAGIEPEGWLLRATDSPHETSALALAALMGRSSWFDTLRNIPAAVDGARSFAHSARELSQCPVGALATMSRLGVDIGVVDAHGHNLLHLWARSDNAPRSGWTTLGKLCPHLLVARGSSGLTPVDFQRSKISDSARLSKFDALIANIERDLIARSAPASSAKTSAPKPRL